MPLAYLSDTNNPCSSCKTEIRSLSNTLTAASIQIPISTKKNTDVTSQHALKLVCKHSDVNMIQMVAGIHRQSPVRYIWCLLAFEVSLNYLRSEHLVSQEMWHCRETTTWSPMWISKGREKQVYFPHVICILNFHPLFQNELSLATLFLLSKEVSCGFFVCFSFFSDKLLHLGS